MTTTSRRQFIQFLGYGIAAAAGGTASSALAGSQPALSAAPGSALPSCDITIYQQQSVGRETVTLMNLTGRPVTLDSMRPVGLENVHGRLAVRVNHMPHGAVKLQPGERLTFEIEAHSSGSVDQRWQIPNVASGQVSIRSDHPAFNGVIPVTVFDSQAA